jgi:hypothetical protein
VAATDDVVQAIEKRLREVEAQLASYDELAREATACGAPWISSPATPAPARARRSVNPLVRRQAAHPPADQEPAAVPSADRTSPRSSGT